MNPNSWIEHGSGRRVSRLAGIVLAAAFAGLLGAQAMAQETPEPTPAAPLPTPVATHEAQESPAIMRLVAPEDSVGVGEEFEVQVMVEGVEHLASFDFAMPFDPELMALIGVEDAGELLSSGERQVLCSDPMVRNGTLLMSCVTPNLPFCLGGPPGVSGSGILARVIFRAEQEGTASLELTEPTSLLLDDLHPCDPDAGRAIDIPHRRVDASFELGGGSDGVPWLLVGIIAGAIAAVLMVGAVGFLWYQRRRTGASSID